MPETNQPLTLVFGTSADPFHLGHASLIIAAAKSLNQKGFCIDEVLILPTYRHHNIQDSSKRSLPLTFENRFRVCQIAALEISNALSGVVEKVAVSKLEEELVKDSHRPNFTVETLTELRKQVSPQTELAFLLGVDNLSGADPAFSHWYQWEELIRLTSLVICPRKGFAINQDYTASLRRQGANLIYLEDVVVSEVSSSEIRSRVEAGQSPYTLAEEGLIEYTVARFIEENNVAETWRRLDSSRSTPETAEGQADDNQIEAQIGKILTQKKLTIALAESCTGGLISHRITNIPGSSEYFVGGIVSYAYAAKVSLLGVSWDTLKTYGAVSSETVLEMARGVKRALFTDIGLSVSCIAGPGGATPNKPIGTSWCALSTPDGEWSFHFLLREDRVGNKESLAQKALEVLLDYLQR